MFKRGFQSSLQKEPKYSICTVTDFRLPFSLQIQYKKGHDERKAKYTSLAEPPEVELAKKVFAQRSDVSTTTTTTTLSNAPAGPVARACLDLTQHIFRCGWMQI